MKFAILTILSVQFSDINGIYNVVQPSPLFLKLFHYSREKLCTIEQ